MAISFYNIKSKEVRVATSEPMIAAYLNSSNMGPNTFQGQDFGWRLAPEIVVRMKNIKSNFALLDKIAAQFKRPLENLSDSDILRYISAADEKATLFNSPTNDFTGEYEEEIRVLEGPSEEDIAKEKAIREQLKEEARAEVEAELKEKANTAKKK